MAQRPLWVMSGHEQGLVNIRFSPEKTASNCCLREQLANVEPHAAPRGPSASLPRCEISILYRGAGPFAADRGRHFSVTRVTGGSPSKP